LLKKIYVFENIGKAIIIVGARQVVKTTLINKILKKEDFLFLDADAPTIRNLLLTPNCCYSVTKIS